MILVELKIVLEFYVLFFVYSELIKKWALSVVFTGGIIFRAVRHFFYPYHIEL